MIKTKSNHKKYKYLLKSTTSNNFILIYLTFYGEYLNIEAIKSIASFDALGITSLSDYGLHYGKVYPTVLANYQPSGHSSFVGVPNTLHI